jgi:hypothetical protein
MGTSAKREAFLCFRMGTSAPSKVFLCSSVGIPAPGDRRKSPKACRPLRDPPPPPRPPPSPAAPRTRQADGLGGASPSRYAPRTPEPGPPSRSARDNFRILVPPTRTRPRPQRPVLSRGHLTSHPYTTQESFRTRTARAERGARRHFDDALSEKVHLRLPHSVPKPSIRESSLGSAAWSALRSSTRLPGRLSRNFSTRRVTTFLSMPRRRAAAVAL